MKTNEWYQTQTFTIYKYFANRWSRTGGLLLLNHLKDDFEIHLALYSHINDYAIPPEIKILDLRQPLLENKIIRFLKLPKISYTVYRYCKKNGIRISVAFLYRPCYINAFMKSIWRYRGHVIMWRAHTRPPCRKAIRPFTACSPNLW
ncbi:MAG: hypothetical protein IPO42_14950 [Chitinophagaceae bacterium]|nr:hypothetical protein [Chitinophagaceae bacterium]